MVEELECLDASGLQAEVLQLQAGLLWDRLVPQVKRESRDACSTQCVTVVVFVFHTVVALSNGGLLQGKSAMQSVYSGFGATA